MKIEFKNVLILAPHTDDGEIGCGGLISKITRKGGQVRYVAFSSAKRSLREQGKPEDLLIKEVKKATEKLGIEAHNLAIHDFDVRNFDKSRQEILDILINERQSYKPDIILAPSLDDMHQDHSIVAREALRAFKNFTVLGYEMPWNNIEFQTRVFFKLSHLDVQNKANALRFYESQQHRPYLNEEFIYSLAKTRGVQIQADFAESFEVMRLVLD